MKPVDRVALYLVALVGAAAAQPVGPYVNAALGYSFAVPPGWRVEPGYQASGVHIVNFPRSEEAPELPGGAATVHIIPYDMYAGTYVRSVDEWVRLNARIAQRDVTRRDLRCESRDRKRALVCIEVRSFAQLSPEDPALPTSGCISNWGISGSAPFLNTTRATRGQNPTKPP